MVRSGSPSARSSPIASAEAPYDAGSSARNALIPYFSNPGGFNVDAVLVIGGALIWSICAI
jgi:hypothetical protein